MAVKIKEEHNIYVDADKLRKTWGQLTKTYRELRDELRKQTGQEGYEQFWAKKCKKLFERFERMDQFMGEKADVEDAMVVESSALETTPAK